jgi:hypothetical protein
VRRLLGNIFVAEGAVLDIDNDGMLSSAEFAEMAKLQAKHSREDTSCRHAAFELRVDGYTCVYVLETDDRAVARPCSDKKLVECSESYVRSSSAASSLAPLAIKAPVAAPVPLVTPSLHVAAA